MQNTLTTFDIEGSATGDIQVYIPALRPGQAPLFDSMDEFKKVVLESAVRDQFYCVKHSVTVNNGCKISEFIFDEVHGEYSLVMFNFLFNFFIDSGNDGELFTCSTIGRKGD